MSCFDTNGEQQISKSRRSRDFTFAPPQRPSTPGCAACQDFVVGLTSLTTPSVGACLLDGPHVDYGMLCGRDTHHWLICLTVKRERNLRAQTSIKAHASKGVHRHRLQVGG